MWLSMGSMRLRTCMPWASVRLGAVRALHGSPAHFEKPKLPPSVSEAKRTEKTMKRFWKDVFLAYEEASMSNDEHFQIQLDKRSVRTPGGAVLRVPGDRPLLACLIAQEWDEQSQVVKPHSLPLTSLVARAIDGLSQDATREEAESLLLRYFDTDAVCYHETKPAKLVQMQEERWAPLIEWAKTYFQIPIVPAQGTLLHAQAPEARDKIARVMAGIEPLDLAALERAVMTSKSMIIGMALVHRHIEAEQAALAAEVETATQASMWGAIDDSHDVDHAELRRQLASVACAQVITEPELVERFVKVLRERKGAFRT